jgi:hypothetical protein
VLVAVVLLKLVPPNFTDELSPLTLPPRIKERLYCCLKEPGLKVLR